MSKKFFNELVFNSGLTVTDQGDCEYVIDADHYIIDEPYCDWEPPEHLASSQKFFNRISVGTGLWVNQGDAGDCDWRINADHQITDSGTCGVTATVDNKFFNQLIFNSGLNVIEQSGCVYSIDADHLITSSGTCGASDGVSKGFFKELVFNSGLKVSDQGDCEYVIDADHYISSTGTTAACHANETDINKEFFNHLSFTSGMGVKDMGDCKYEIWSCPTQVRDSGYCNWTPSVATACADIDCVVFGTGMKVTSLVDGDAVVEADHYLKDTSTCNHPSVVPNYKFFNKLNFQSGLYLADNGNCEYSLQADHYISSTGTTCTVTETDINKEFFTHLSFTSGMGVKDIGDCKYEIWSCAPTHQVRDSGYCDWTPIVGAECTGVDCTVFGTGLKIMSIEGGNAVVEADHYIHDSGYCNHVPSDPLEGEGRFFNKLIAGTGLKVIESGSCAYRIDADHYITDSGRCGHTATVSNKFFNRLVFNSGLNVIDQGECEFIIDADHRITDLAYCDEVPTVTNQFFSHLQFGAGLWVKDNGNCDYTIHADHYIYDSGYCDYIPSDPTQGEGRFFDALIFGSGLKVIESGNGLCNYRIDADHYISSTGTTCAETESINNKFFTHLSFTSGIGVKAVEDTVGDCKYEVWACPVQVQDSGYCDWSPTVATACSDVECIVFGTGLKATSLVGGDIVVGADHYISATGSTALGGTSGINPTDAGIDHKFFTHLSFTDRMGVKAVEDAAGDCKYEVWSQGVEAMDLSCYGSSAYCNNNNLMVLTRPYQSPSMTGLVGGRGLGLYYITGATAEQGMHYIESTLSVSSGSVHTGCGQEASTTYVTSLEFIDLGRGLEGIPGHSCGAESDCDMTIRVNRYITDSGRCNPIPAATVSNKFFNELIFNSGLRVAQEGSGCNYVIDADHYISSTASNAIGTETDIDREFFTHISFSDTMGVKDLGDCKYEVWSQCLQGVDISCTTAQSDYCGNLNLGGDLGEVLCMTGLVAGPGLDLYKITGDVDYQGMHYIETNLRISSGCSTTGYIRGLETITLGCGLSGTPEDTCTDSMTGEKIGSCEMTLNLNPLACPGTVTSVRYVDDICCTGGGIEIIYKHLRFSSCGLFTGVTGTDSCS